MIHFKEKINLNNVNFDELMIDDNYEMSISNFNPNCSLRKILGDVIIDILNCFLQKDNQDLLKNILDCFKSNRYNYDNEYNILSIETNLKNLIK